MCGLNNQKYELKVVKICMKLQSWVFIPAPCLQQMSFSHLFSVVRVTFV